jgi:hypothetical protein
MERATRSDVHHERLAHSTLKKYLVRGQSRHIRKVLLSKLNNFRILGLSLSSSGFGPHKNVRTFFRAFSQLSTVPDCFLSIAVTAGVSIAWLVGWSSYKETNPQNLTNVGVAGSSYPHRWRCEEKSGLSPIEQHACDSLG